MKLSEIYGKQVTLNGGAAGYIIKVYTDGKRVTGAMCADGNEREFFLDIKGIRISDGRLLLSASEKGAPTGIPLALGRACYSHSGAYMGVLNEITLKGAKLSSAKIDGRKHAAENLVFGDIIIVNPSAKALKHDVTKDGKVLFRSGETPDKKLIDRAISLGEYVQTNLKRI